MPHDTHYKIPAKNYIDGGVEIFEGDIKGTKWEKYGAPHRTILPPPPTKRNIIRTPEYLSAKDVEYKAHLEHLRQTAKEMREVNKQLVDRIGQVAPELLMRIEKPAYEPQPPIPENIHFRKSKIILHEQEIWKVLLAA